MRRTRRPAHRTTGRGCSGPGPPGGTRAATPRPIPPGTTSRSAAGRYARAAHRVDNAYPRAVRPEGNPAARAVLDDVFEVTDRAWRGIGVIPDSGWRLSGRYRDHDAEHRFAVDGITTREPAACRSGEVLQGLLKPHECEAFGTTCTPRTPLGATMVSSEGACAAYYLYRRLDLSTPATPDASLEGSPVV